MLPLGLSLTAACLFAPCCSEVSRGRRDDRDEHERRQRELSVKRRLGESSDLQQEAMQLISQSEMRIHRIGKVSVGAHSHGFSRVVVRRVFCWHSRPLATSSGPCPFLQHIEKLDASSGMFLSLSPDHQSREGRGDVEDK